MPGEIRKPVVAGQFYPATGQEIRKLIASFVIKEPSKKDVIACVLPHAGYVYSGRVAVETVLSMKLKDTVVLIGPNHSGYGEEFSIMTEGAWQTPMGEVQVNSGLARQMASSSPYLKEDTVAHRYEHSLEVELPVLQYFRKSFDIVPLTIFPGELSVLKRIGEQIAEAIIAKRLKGSVIIAASTDMTHYEPQDRVEKKDRIAIEAILALNEAGLFEGIARHGISMCGYAAVAVMLSAAKTLGATKGELIKYQTSAAASNDSSSVVGYAGMVIY
ncbi:MAG: AmmeMemoRadiSam system protein B [Candidatus Omnitrophota bacterium]